MSENKTSDKQHPFPNGTPVDGKIYKAATTKDAKESLRRIRDFGGYDGHGRDEWLCRIAQLIDDLEIALASQIDITNTERAAKERLEKAFSAKLTIEDATRAAKAPETSSRLAVVPSAEPAGIQRCAARCRARYPFIRKGRVVRQGIAEGDRVRVYFSGAGQADLQGTVLYMPQATGDCWIIETERTVEHVQTFARIAKDKTHDIHSLSPKDK